MASAIPLVIAAFEDALGDVVALDDVSISRGEPKERVGEGIIFGDVTATRDYGALGVQPTPLDEQIRLNFGAWVIATGGQYEDAETRLWVIFDAMEAKLRTDLSLEGSWLFSRLTNIERSYVPVDKGKAAQVTFVCEGRARI